MAPEGNAPEFADKQQFENSTSNAIGVNIFEPGTGKPTAITLWPGQTIWLSEDEQRMTANAPRDPSNNPFISGALRPINEQRPIGSDVFQRPIHGVTAQHKPDDEVQRLAEEEEPEADPGIFTDEELERIAQEKVEAHERAEAALRQGLAGPLPEKQVEVEAPTPIEGSLHGDDTATHTDEDDEEAAEEHAAFAEGEETGSAVDPQGEPEEGEFAKHEEVGDPDAPAASKPDVPGRRTPPAED